MNRPVIAVLLVVLVLPSVVEAKGVYLGVAAGQSKLRDTLGANTISGSDTGYRGFVGYRFPGVFAVELDYTDFGSFSETGDLRTLEVKASNVALWGYGNLPLGRMFELFLKVGVARTEGETTVSGIGDPETKKAADTDLGWGIGGGLKLGKSFMLRLEFEQYQTETVQQLELLSLGIQFNF